MIWQELRYWSIMRCGNEARISAVDARGDEYYVLIDGGHGKDYRERRAAALDRISDAMTRGDEPGEVV